MNIFLNKPNKSPPYAHKRSFKKTFKKTFKKIFN